MSDSVWVEKYSKTHHKKYYYNSKTKESKWDDPRIATAPLASAPLPAAPLAAAPAPQVVIEPKNEALNVKEEEKVSFFDFLMECLRNEVNNEYVWDRKYDADFTPTSLLFEKIGLNQKNEQLKVKKDFAFYWISKVPYVVKEVDHELGVVAIISLFDKSPSLFDSNEKTTKELRNSLCGFNPSYEFNLAAFAAFIGVQTQPHSVWRDTVWRSVYKPFFDSRVAWDATNENWAVISKVRVSLCISYGSKASLCFMKEMEGFLQGVANIR